MMKITWLGHACFYAAGDAGTWVTDPYDKKVGYPLHPCRADLLTISHSHSDHSDTSWVQAGTVQRRAGACRAGALAAAGLPSFHDGNQGLLRGPNLIFTVEMDGLRLCHLGDLGHPLTQEQAGALGPVDVLMVPVGGNYTLDGAQAAALVLQLRPRLVIAMHFFNEYTPSFQIAGPQEFIRLTGAQEMDGSGLKVTRADLSAGTRAVVLRPLHGGVTLP